MSKITCSKEIAVVKIFINVITGCFLFSSSICLSEEDNNTASTNSPSGGLVIQQAPDPNWKDREEYRDKREKENRRLDDCKSAAEQIRAERKAISDACKEASLGSTESCVEKTQSCGEASSADSYDSIGSFAKVLGVPSEVTSALDPAFGNACPQMSGQEFFAEKERLEGDLKDTKQDLDDLDNDRADIEADFNDEMIKIQETLTKANEDLKEKKLKISQDNRERIAEFNNTQNQAKEELRKKGSDMLRLRGQLIQSQRDKTLRLLAMSESSGMRACEKAANDVKKGYSSSGTGNMSQTIKDGKKKKEELIKIYKDCMASFDQQRIALIESKRQEQDELNNQINNLQSSMDEIQNTLNLADTQLKEIQGSATKEEADAIQSVIDLGKRSQEQMQAANQKMQTKMQALAKKTQTLTEAVNRITNNIQALGTPPERSSSSAPRQISSAISSAYENIEDIKAEFGDCKNLDPKGKGKKTGPPSSSSAKKAGQ